MEYSRRLSPTRRATLNFSVGSSTMDLPNVPAAGIVEGRQSEVSAEAALNYQFSRTWMLRGAYRRGAEFVAELSYPVFVDGVTTTLTGDMGRRVHFSSSAAYSSGQGLQPGTNQDLVTYTGDVRLSFDIVQRISSFVEYPVLLLRFFTEPSAHARTCEQS